jgi:hypothetical protein
LKEFTLAPPNNPTHKNNNNNNNNNNNPAHPKPPDKPNMLLGVPARPPPTAQAHAATLTPPLTLS